jgi:hypothetical protein
MSQSYADCFLKVERANQHIQSIQQRISRLEDSFSVVIETDPESGRRFLKYDLTDKVAGKDIGMLIGDTLHNLKCALDYAWLRTLERHAPSAITSKTQFPAYAAEEFFEAALKKAKIDTSCPALCSLMLTQMMSYAAGSNSAIWALKELNILDKHRLLLPLIGYTSITDLQMEDETGEAVPGFAAGTFQLPPWYIHIPDGWRVKVKGKPAISILFDEGTPTPHLDAASHLEMFSVIVKHIIQTLEAFA